MTVDVYDTLVRYDGAQRFFEGLLAGQLAAAERQSYRRRYDEEMVASFRRIATLDFRRTPFFTIKDLYRSVFEKLAPEFGVEMDLGTATAGLAQAVSEMQVFPETRQFVERLRRTYPHCLVSDIDDDILERVLACNGLAFQRVVTSEAARCYKESVGSDMFPRAAAALEVPVARLVHIGDWLPDVRGARAAGAKVIRVRRDGSAFDQGGTQPHAEAADLLGALDLVSQV